MADVTNTNKTVNKNVIVPDVYAQLVREKIAGKVVVSQFAEVDDTLTGKPGEKVIMPAWKYIGDAKDVTIGQAMDKTKMKQSKTEATIKMVAAPAVEIQDYDKAVEFGNAVDEASEQQAISMARKLDTDCIAALLAAPMSSALATEGVVTFDEMIEAESLFGDDFNVEDVDAIIIHSAYKKSFIKMDGFVSRELTITAEGNGICRNNIIGSFMGVPVVVTDRLVKGAKKAIVILKKGALKVLAKEAPFTEVARDASTRTSVIYCSDYYGVALVKDDAVVVMTKGE